MSPGDFRRVLLTGATGFIGRFVLCELLRQKPEVAVDCLVRADDAEHGFERLCTALTRAEIWDDAFTERIRVLPGDIRRKRLGLEVATFDDLCRNVDAVFHFAADLKLASPYAAIRDVNASSVRNLLALCLRRRFKHMFHASTMGVFPEYFCTFANEFSRGRIDHHMQPGLASMKRTFPLGLMGYPWSKLVAEQSLLFARSAGMPLAIFRLPQTYLAAGTGYTRSNDIAVRLAIAITETGMIPHGSLSLWTEPVDALSRFCTAIAMNPRRHFTLYHCCNPEPTHHDVKMDDYGFEIREVSYETFKQACLARGEQQALHGHWPVLDRFAPYWFSNHRRVPPLPVSDRAFRADCPQPIVWPGAVTSHTRSFAWIVRHREEWPYPIRHGRLRVEHLLARVEHHARRLELPTERVCPEWMRTGLRRLVASIEASDAPVPESKQAHVAHYFCRTLRSNAALAKERYEHPEMEREELAQPVFVLGPNRTGTTLLHRLLACDERWWALRTYELDDPIPPAGDYAARASTSADPRRAAAEDWQTAFGISRLLGGVHDIGTDDPEEDFPLLQRAFASWSFTMFYRVPDYLRWLARTGSRSAYAHHRSLLQQYGWHRRQRQADHLGQWLLKMPFHLMELEMLVETYPDALFIMTHREPRQFMGSWNSLVARLRSLSIAERPPRETGAEQLAFMGDMLDRAMQFRNAHPELEPRWMDVHFTDLVAHPLEVVRRVYERLLRRRLEPAVAAGMVEWLAWQAQHRRRQALHEYALADYGLTPEMVDSRFARYREFALAKGIAVSR